MKKTITCVLAGAVALTMALGLAGCSSASSAASSEVASSVAASSAAASSEAAASESAGESAAAVMTHAEYMAAEMDTEVTVETYVQAKQSWWEDKATLYTQDQDGAYFVYDAACTQELYDQLTPGAKIRVNGYKGEWAGEVEIMDATIELVEGGDTFLAEPLDVTAMLANEEELISHQNELVSFTGMTVEPSTDADGNEAAFLYSWDGSGEDGSDLYFNVSVDGQTYTFTVESYLCDNTTDVYNAVEALQVGDVIDMQGFLYWYEGVNPHITSVAAAQ